ncbi:hypothetical protein AWV79_35540 [Cupriavidus sp. UYMMa02A]|nr:hypothetical protein AWV79_35540 [Cupriavidus sp. UYMMa02A]
MEIYAGFVRTQDGEALTFHVCVPAGATADERDAAAFRAMKEQFNDRRRFIEPAVGLVLV